MVAKLLLAARPHVAIFGQKDFQQWAVIRRMVGDLGFGVEIIAAPTVRAPDGLALSSRNVRLGPAARQQATVLVRSLEAAERALRAGAVKAFVVDGKDVFVQGFVWPARRAGAAALRQRLSGIPCPYFLGNCKNINVHIMFYFQ